MKMLPQAAPDQRQLLQSARVIFAIATDPNESLSVHNLALKAGMTEDAVVEALNSPEFFDAITREFRAVSGLMIRRGMTQMASIVDSEKTLAKDKVAAYRALLETYRTVAEKADPRDDAARLENFQHKLAALDKLKKPSVKVTTTP